MATAGDQSVRIAVSGPPLSGKKSLASRLAAQLAIPVFNVDKYMTTLDESGERGSPAKLAAVLASEAYATGYILVGVDLAHAVVRGVWCVVCGGGHMQWMTLLRGTVNNFERSARRAVGVRVCTRYPFRVFVVCLSGGGFLRLILAGVVCSKVFLVFFFVLWSSLSSMCVVVVACFGCRGAVTARGVCTAR